MTCLIILDSKASCGKYCVHGLLLMWFSINCVHPVTMSVSMTKEASSLLITFAFSILDQSSSPLVIKAGVLALSLKVNQSIASNIFTSSLILVSPSSFSKIVVPISSIFCFLIFFLSSTTVFDFWIVCYMKFCHWAFTYGR